MKHDVICAWLGLMPQNWPPDHYSLLGLEPGESDVARIEQRVHERLARLRCYQISHPEQATEAMNLLAQAFICLTDKDAKKGYDATLLARRGGSTAAAQLAPAVRKPAPPGSGSSPRKPTTGLGRNPGTPLPAAMADTAVGAAPVTQVDWQATVAPPPVRLPAPSAGEAASAPAPEVREEPPPPAAPGVSAAPVSGDNGGETTTPALVAVPVQAPPVEPAASGPLAGYKGFSPALLRLLTSRRGLGTRQELYRRVRRTRRLLYAWDRAGKYLGKAKRELKRAAEEKELSRALAAIGQHLEGFPRMLGQPGQPGFRIAARARRPFDPAWFNGLDTTQRELLAMDWAAGRTLLSSHRQFLRQELRALHGLNRWQLAYRAFVNDYPARTLLVLAAIGVALIVYLACLSN